MTDNDNNEEHKDLRGSTSMERMINHVIQVAVVAALSWFALSVTDLKTDTAVIQIRLVEMSKRLEDFRTFMSDRYTGTDAAEAHARIHTLINDHEKRIRMLENGQVRTRFPSERD